MKGTKAAVRYAKALLELALEQNIADQVENDLKYLQSVNNEAKDFEVVLQSPVINTDKKIAIFHDLFGQFEKLTTMFIDLIAKNRREALLPEIANSYINQLKAHRGIVPMTLVSATALDHATKDHILAKLQGGFPGKTLEVAEKIDQNLIGGFVITMNDWQIDASVANQLNNLKQRLTR